MNMFRRGAALNARSGLRAFVVVGAYIATAAVVLVTVLILKRHAPASALGPTLSFFFISSLAAGLEPATAKAALLRDGASTTHAPLLMASAAKALAASPILALIWRFSDPHLDVGALLLTPFIAIAGFAATDLRVLRDVEGRHALAIGLKQGSLSGGLVVVSGLVLAGAPTVLAMAVATLLRLLLAPGAAGWAALRISAARPWRAAGGLLADMRWIELMAASVISAVGGSTDRILALRYLPAPTYASYYLLYEVFSKFWVLPYVLGPILFARMAAGHDSRAFVRRGWLVMLGAGTGYLALIGAAFFLTPGPLHRILGPTFGPQILAFAAAMVLAALTMFGMTYLQASGHTRRATLLIAFNTLISAAVFFYLVRTMGLPGLLFGWLAKTVLEFIVMVIAVRAIPSRASGASRGASAAAG